MKLLLPLIGLLMGVGVGVGAGVAFAPEQDAGPEATLDTEAAVTQSDDTADGSLETVMLNEQFIVPVVDDQRVNSLIVMSIGLEVTAGTTEVIFAQEARLRDTFLQVLFEHANMGGFNGAFTNARNLDLLRTALFKAANQQMGEDIKGILITDLARQDV